MTQSPDTHPDFLDEDLLAFDDPDVINQRQLDAAIGINFIFDSFDYSLHTFQYEKDKSHIAKVYNFDEREKALQDAISYNDKGYDIYFMVNEGDGIIHEGKKLPRCQASVKYLSSCFIDTDSCPMKNVTFYLKVTGLTPHFIIESSPDRFHVYFNFEKQEKSVASLLQWRAIQNILARLGDVKIKNPSKTLGTDSTMHDYSKLLRVPGFLHISKNTTVKIISDNYSGDKSFPLYTLEQLFSVTKAQTYLDYNETTYGTYAPSQVPDLNSTEIIEPGDRYQSLQSLALSLANRQDMDEKEKVKAYKLFVRTRLDNTDHVYAAGKELTPKAIDLYKSARDKVIKETVIHKEQVQKSLDKSDTPTNSLSEIWHLPDEFYLNAPHGFGELVKQGMAGSKYPCAAMCFATFLAGISILKAKTHLTPEGGSPALYMVNVAIASYGKGAPYRILQNTFAHYGLSRLITNDIRSDRGLINHMAANSNCGFALLDEVGPFLTAIQKKSAPSYLKNTLKFLLTTFSSGGLKGVAYGKVASTSTKKGEPEVIMNNPMIAVCGFTVPATFESLFTQESIDIGLFQRFITVMPKIVLEDANYEIDSNTILKGDIFERCRNDIILSTAPDELENDSCGASEGGNDDSEDSEESGTAPGPVNPASLDNNYRAAPLIQARYTPEALERYKAVDKQYREKLILGAYNNTDAHDNSPLYGRLVEQAERIATVLCPGDEIDLPTLNYAIEFMESRLKATVAYVDKYLFKGVGSVSIERENKIIKAISQLCEQQNTEIVRKKDVYAKIRKSFKDGGEFAKALQEVAELGKIEIIPHFKMDEKDRKACVGLKLGEVLE